MALIEEKILMFLGVNIQGDIGPLTVYKSREKNTSGTARPHP